MYCRCKYAEKTSNTILHGHMVKKHSVVWSKLLQNEHQLQQQKISNHFKPVTPYSRNSLKTVAGNRKLLLLCARDLRPFCMATTPAFQDYIRFWDPRATFAPRQRLAKEILTDIYTEEMTSIIEKLSVVKYACLTTDGWTSRNNVSFECCTVHFWNEKKKALETKLLACKELPGSHTALRIRQFVDDVLDEFHIKDKVISCTTDCASNMQAAFPQEGTAPHIPCFAHRLNTAVQTAVTHSEDICKLRHKIAKICTFFRRSTQSRENFDNIQLELGLTPKKMMLECSTRWNSLYTMLERALELQLPITTFMRHMSKKDKASEKLKPIDDEDWELVAGTVKLLKPLYTITVQMSGQKYVTGSQSIPEARSVSDHYSCVERELRAGEYNEDELVHPFAKRLAQEVTLKVNDLETRQVLGLATLLDPRYKAQFFIRQENMERWKNALLEELKTVNLDDPANQEQVTQDAPEEEVDMTPLQILVRNSTDHVRVTSADEEFQGYFSRPRTDGDPFKWWAEHGRQSFPLMSELAFKYLIVPGTSVPSERVFSNANNIITQKRNRLANTTAHRLIFLHANCQLPAPEVNKQ